MGGKLMNWNDFTELYNEDRKEHFGSEPEYQCRECEEVKSPLVVSVKYLGKNLNFKCCPDCGEELEVIE
jgi:transcription initiation factor IIE alpha subunit